MTVAAFVFRHYLSLLIILLESLENSIRNIHTEVKSQGPGLRSYTLCIYLALKTIKVRKLNFYLCCKKIKQFTRVIVKCLDVLNFVPNSSKMCCCVCCIELFLTLPSQQEINSIESIILQPILTILDKIYPFLAKYKTSKARILSKSGNELVPSLVRGIRDNNQETHSQIAELIPRSFLARILTWPLIFKIVFGILFHFTIDNPS